MHIHACQNPKPQSTIDMETTKPSAVLLASPGIGHAIPILELGKRLLTDHGFGHVTALVVTKDLSFAKSRLEKLSDIPNLALDFILLDDVSEEIDAYMSLLARLAVMMRQALPKIRSAFLALKPRPKVLVVDLFGTGVFPVAEEIEIEKKYVFVTNCALFLALTVYMASIDKEELIKRCENRQLLLIPGCLPVQLDPIQDLVNNRDLAEYLLIGSKIPTADAVLVNTWQDLEPRALASLGDPGKLGLVMKVPVHPVGPLIRPVEPGFEHWLQPWLDLQPTESVVYVSFGSGGTLTAEQTAELAWGLELSRKRFVWAVRPPVQNDASAAMFEVSNQATDHLASFLPEGFITRTLEMGRVVPFWAPQTKILAHPSIGGFISHCGWNSTLESLVHGVPMVAWPLYAEQKMNSSMLTEILGIAVRPEASPLARLVRREEIEGMVRKLTEGEEGKEMRKKVKELKTSAENAIREGGSSFISLSKLANL